MTLEIGLLADHKGFTKPKVVGDEYVVDAHVKISVYHTADVVNASDVGLSSITAAVITGQSGPDIEGDCQELANGTNIDDLTVRLRVWGQI